MKLLTKALENKLPKIDRMVDPRTLKIHAHFFKGMPDFDIWIVQGNKFYAKDEPLIDNDTYGIHGIIKCNGYTSISNIDISELEKVGFPFPVERETRWSATPALPFLKSLIEKNQNCKIDSEVEGWLEYHDNIERYIKVTNDFIRVCEKDISEYFQKEIKKADSILERLKSGKKMNGKDVLWLKQFVFDELFRLKGYVEGKTSAIIARDKILTSHNALLDKISNVFLGGNPEPKSKRKVSTLDERDEKVLRNERKKTVKTN